MERSYVSQAYDHVIGIDRNYTDWPSTFGPCSTKECSELGRGSGKCAVCHEIDLAKLVGDGVARDFHESVKVRGLLVDLVKVKAKAKTKAKTKDKKGG